MAGRVPELRWRLARRQRGLQGADEGPPSLKENGLPAGGAEFLRHFLGSLIGVL